MKHILFTKTIKYLALFYLIFSSLHFTVNHYLHQVGFRVNPNHDLRKLLDIYVLDWLIVVTFLSILSYYLERNKKLIDLNYRNILFHFLLALLLALIISFATNVLIYFFKQENRCEFDMKIAFYRAITVFPYNFLIYFGGLGIIYYDNFQRQKIYFKNRKSDYEKLLIEAQLSNLKAHIDPHFMFNTLNNISALIELNNNEAQKAVANLSYILRESIYKKPNELVTLKEDVVFLKKYIEIIKTRFQEDISLNLDIEDNAMNYKIPHFLIQPILENAIKHGYSLKHKKLIVSLNIFIDKNRLKIHLHNDGQPLDKSFNEIINLGKGISNTIKRLRIIFKDNFSFELDNVPNKTGVLFKLELPLIKV